jgi:hypothetical protein
MEELFRGRVERSYREDAGGSVTQVPRNKLHASLASLRAYRAAQEFEKMLEAVPGQGSASCICSFCRVCSGVLCGPNTPTWEGIAEMVQLLVEPSLAPTSVVSYNPSTSQAVTCKGAATGRGYHKPKKQARRGSVCMTLVMQTPGVWQKCCT